MSLQATNLLVQMAQLPATFVGAPQDWLNEGVRRMKIMSPSGTNFIYIGDTEPISNVGPWLKDGLKWYVWDDSAKRYAPLDISDSETVWFTVGPTEPTSSNPLLWLQVKDGLPVSWWYWNAAYDSGVGAWLPFANVIPSGATSLRPTSPEEYQNFFDTSIDCHIFYHRGKWRTVSGCPGDIKAVAFRTATDALLYNPGWSLLGDAQQSLRGRIITQATKDAESPYATNLTADENVPVRRAFEVFGETDFIAMDTSSFVTYPPQLALWHLVKDTD